MAKPKKTKTLFDKVNEVDSTFAEEAYSLTEDQLKDKLVLMAKYDTEIEQAKKDDTDLAALREQLGVANETYSGPLKANRLKRRFVFEILANRGK
jgi:hypothetical protein